MIRNLKELLGYTVHARDGQIGVVEDFLFDDHDWAVRYVAVDSQEWLDHRRLLFSTRAFGELDLQNRVFPVRVDRETIRNSPPIDRGRAPDRQQEVELHNYYQWPLYWNPDEEGGLGPGSLAAYPLVELAEEMRENASPNPLDNPHLHSFQQLLGFNLRARDGAIGDVNNVLVEDESWNILYLVVDTGGWLPGRKVLVSPNWVERVDWHASRVEVDLSQETVRNSPEYDPSAPLDQDYEARLSDHYRKDR